MNKEELWKDIVGYEGLYQISSLGRVKSLYGWNGRRYIKREKYLNPSKQRNGKYCRLVVSLKKNNNRESFRVHRLVAKAFIPNLKNLEDINHIDNNPLNNKVENLEWCNAKENRAWCSLQNRDTPISKEQELEIIKLYKSGLYPSQIYKRFNIISLTPIYRILKKYNILADGTSRIRNKYYVDRNKLLDDFKLNIRCRDLYIKYECPYNLICRYKYLFKKEGLL
jgi:hypothetical protein